MREQALLSRELVRLDRHVPVDDRLGRGPRAAASIATNCSSCSPSSAFAASPQQVCGAARREARRATPWQADYQH